jgi:hypothetical protein
VVSWWGQPKAYTSALDPSGSAQYISRSTAIGPRSSGRRCPNRLFDLRHRLSDNLESDSITTSFPRAVGRRVGLYLILPGSMSALAFHEKANALVVNGADCEFSRLTGFSRLPATQTRVCAGRALFAGEACGEEQEGGGLCWLPSFCKRPYIIDLHRFRLISWRGNGAKRGAIAARSATQIS